MSSGISQKWSQLAVNMVGSSDGKHCHWCKFRDTDGESGEVTCANAASRFSDGGRIRSWDGMECADKCGCFELDDWYKDDANYDGYFGDENPTALTVPNETAKKG